MVVLQVKHEVLDGERPAPNANLNIPKNSGGTYAPPGIFKSWGGFSSACQ
jgi:hypothetical protein